MSGLELRLLGGFEIIRDGERVDLRNKKARALLAYLALPVGTSHAREKLAGLLWGEMSDERARHNLRQSVSALRRAVGDGAIVADGDQLALAAEIRVDADLLGRADDPETAAALYTGPLLADLQVGEDPYDDWLASERTRLSGIACRQLATLATTREQGGDIDGAIAACQQLLGIDEASEEAHRQLMRLYQATGQRTAALRQYEQCADALRRILGATPSAATEALHAALAEPVETSCTEPPSAEPQPTADVAPPDRPSIAVMPFAELSGDPEERYFGIGLADDIAVSLCRFQSLFVISPFASFAYRDRDWTPRQVGRELGVQFVVTGSVLRSGSRFSASVQLIDAGHERQVWAQRYQRELSDLFQVQEEITRTVVATLVRRVEAAVLERAKNKSPANLAAYDYMLRGKVFHHRWTLDDNLHAVEMFEKAIERDDGYALAHAWLGCALAQQASFRPDPTLLPRCMVEVRKAHALDDGESECYRIFAAYHLLHFELDFDKAEHFQRRAHELNPNDDRIVCQNGELATCLGDHAEGERWVRLAMRLNPYHPDSFHYHLARALYHLERYDEALTTVRRIASPSSRHLIVQAAAAARAGDGERAAAAARRLREASPGFDFETVRRALPYRRPEDLEAVAEGLRLAGIPM